MVAPLPLLQQQQPTADDSSSGGSHVTSLTQLQAQAAGSMLSGGLALAFPKMLEAGAMTPGAHHQVLPAPQFVREEHMSQSPQCTTSTTSTTSITSTATPSKQTVTTPPPLPSRVQRAVMTCISRVKAMLMCTK